MHVLFLVVWHVIPWRINGKHESNFLWIYNSHNHRPYLQCGQRLINIKIINMTVSDKAFIYIELQAQVSTSKNYECRLLWLKPEKRLFLDLIPNNIYLLR